MISYIMISYYIYIYIISADFTEFTWVVKGSFDPAAVIMVTGT